MRPATSPSPTSLSSGLTRQSPSVRSFHPVAPRVLGTLALAAQLIVAFLVSGWAEAKVALGQENAAPVLSFSIPSPAYLDAFLPFSLVVSAIDADGDDVTFTVSPLPVGATFDGSSGVFSWTPGVADAGTHDLMFCGTDGVSTTCEPYELIVIAQCAPPLADPGGPYYGHVGQRIQFDGSGSFEPNGGILSYAWDFGDGTTGAGAMPVHVYEQSGTFLVTLVVTDGCGPPVSDTAHTTATVIDIEPVALIFKAPNGKVRTFGRDNQLVGFETGTGPPTELVASSMKLTATVCGTTQITPITKYAAIGDLDSDGLPDLDLSFTRADIGMLLGCLPNNSLVTVTATGVTTDGLPVLGSATITIMTRSREAAIEAFASPNPLSLATSIRYRLRSAGNVTVRIYSLQGRLVRTLLDRFAHPGEHEVRWSGRDDEGDPVASGVYLVRIAQREDRAVFKVLVTK